MSNPRIIWFAAIAGIIGALIGFGFGIAFSHLSGRPFSPLWIGICATAGLTLGIAIGEDRGQSNEEQ